MELEYKSQSSQTVFDVSILNLLGMDNIILGLLQPSNKSLVSVLNLDTLLYESDLIENTVIQLDLTATDNSSLYEIKGSDGQSTFDLCIMQYGNLDLLMQMLQDNDNIVSINDIDVNSKIINFNADNTIQAYTPAIIKSKGYSFATIQKTSEDIGDFVWDGTFIIWDGTDKLIY